MHLTASLPGLLRVVGHRRSTSFGTDRAAGTKILVVIIYWQRVTVTGPGSAAETVPAKQNRLGDRTIRRDWIDTVGVCNYWITQLGTTRCCGMS